MILLEKLIVLNAKMVINRLDDFDFVHNISTPNESYGVLFISGILNFEKSSPKIDFFN